MGAPVAQGAAQCLRVGFGGRRQAPDGPLHVFDRIHTSPFRLRVTGTVTRTLMACSPVGRQAGACRPMRKAAPIRKALAEPNPWSAIDGEGRRGATRYPGVARALPARDADDGARRATWAHSAGQG